MNLGQSAADTAPPLVLRRAWIYPAASARPFRGSLLLSRGHIEAMGDDEAVASAAPRSAAVVDLGGRTLLPGLVDAHLHFELYSMSFELVDCETPSLAECLDRVRERAKDTPPGEWIRGHGWNHSLWGRWGTRQDLDGAAPHHPVYLAAKSLHAGWANSLAIHQAGLASHTPDPPDGKIGRESDGTPSGILLEGAMQLVSRLFQGPEPAELARRMARAQDRLWEFGLTGIHDFDGPRCLFALQLLHEEGALGLRVLKNLPVSLLNAAAQLGIREGFGDDWIRFGKVKVFADGALGPRTAAMLEPYDDDPTNGGMALLDTEELVEIGLKAGQHGWGVTVHAIGDRANHTVLDSFAELRRQESKRGWPVRRHRVEHLQLLHPADVKRPAALGLIASMQPIHATSDRLMAERGWGSRNRFAYAWRSQLEAGATLAFGSDAPVEVPNPFWGIHAAITRRQPAGDTNEEGWIPEERLALSQALAAYTDGPALAAGLEGKSGTIRPGAWADLIILDRDPFQLEPEGVRELLPVATMTGGMWRRREF